MADEMCPYTKISGNSLLCDIILCLDLYHGCDILTNQIPVWEINKSLSLTIYSPTFEAMKFFSLCTTCTMDT